MEATVKNVWVGVCSYKKAKCQHCLNTLKEGEEIVSVAKEARWTSVSNYHIKCAEPILKDIVEQARNLIRNVVTVSEKIDAYKKKEVCESTTEV